MIYIDPQTQKRYSYDKRSHDLQYDMEGDSAIATEAVPVIGDWEDYTGSQVVNSRNQQMFAGISNKLFGSVPGIKGEKLGDLDIIGRNKQTTRRRIKRKLVKVGNTNKS